MAASWVYIEDIPKIQEGEIEIRGWLFNKRSSGKVVFLIIRDGTGYIQGVATLDNFNQEELDFLRKFQLSHP